MKKTVKTHSKKLSVEALQPLKNEYLYDKDFYKWTKEQTKLLRENELDKLDIDNLIEEIESLGISDKRSLRSYLCVLLMHLLKKKYQPKKLSKSWEDSIRNSELQIQLILDDSPSLKRFVPKLFEEGYKLARFEASKETGLSLKTFPKESPWEIEEILPNLKKKKS